MRQSSRIQALADWRLDTSRWASSYEVERRAIEWCKRRIPPLGWLFEQLRQ